MLINGRHDGLPKPESGCLRESAFHPPYRTNVTGETDLTDHQKVSREWSIQNAAGDGQGDGQIRCRFGQSHATNGGDETILG